MEQSNEYSQISNFDETQRFNINGEYQYQTLPDNSIQNWEQLLGETSGIDNVYHQDISQSDSTTDQTTSFGFEQQQQQHDIYQYNENLSSEDINPELDYETIIHSKHLYYDPNPQIIRKPTMINPVIYNQNIMVRFLQPPPVSQEPLIIREIRPPQPPPPPPLIIRQRAPPPLSPPPIILREKPPPIPTTMTAKVVTKTLSPIPPPPRSVIVEQLPPLPAKPRDIIIERWIPYEAMEKRKVVVQRAEESKPYPPPRNVIITYEPVQPRIIRQFERLNVTQEDPHHYSSLYGNSLLDTEQLLAQIKELGITEDLSPPQLFNNEQQQNIDEQNYDYNILSQQQFYSEMNNNNYSPTYENLVQGLSPSLSTINYEELNDQQIGQDNNIYSSSGEDLSTQLAQYGITTDSIPY